MDGYTNHLGHNEAFRKYPNSDSRRLPLGGYWVGAATIMRAHLFVYTSMIRSNNQQAEHRFQYLEDRVVIVHPGSHNLCASCSSNTRTSECHMAGGGWGAVM